MLKLGFTGVNHIFILKNPNRVGYRETHWQRAFKIEAFGNKLRSGRNLSLSKDLFEDLFFKLPYCLFIRNIFSVQAKVLSRAGTNPARNLEHNTKS